MKTKDLIKLITLILIVTVFSSCKKYEGLSTVTNNNGNNIVQTETKTLIAAPNFNWRTSNDVILNVTGAKEVGSSVINTLYIKSSVGDFVYFKDRIKMNTDYQLKLNVPSTETKITMVYGNITKTLNLVSDTLTVSYLQ